jgi:hypothetical protein
LSATHAPDKVAVAIIDAHVATAEIHAPPDAGEGGECRRRPAMSSNERTQQNPWLRFMISLLVKCPVARRPGGAGVVLRSRSTRSLRVRPIQRLDSRHQFVRKRKRRFKHHAPPRLGARRSAVEPHPCDRIDELPLTVDEVRDPERVVEHEEGDFASLASPQNLALERAQGATTWSTCPR